MAETDGVGFGEAVALDEVVAEDDAEVLMEGRVERGGSRDHRCGALEAERRGDFATPDAVVDGVFVRGGRVVGVFEGGQFGGDDVAGDGAGEAGLGGCGGADGAAEAVVEPRDGVEGCGAEELQVVEEGEDVPVEIADGGAGPEGALFGEASVNMGEGEVGAEDVGGALDYCYEGAGGGGDGVGVGEDDAFGWAGGAGGVVDGDGVGGLGRVVGRSGEGSAEGFYLVH